MVPLSRFLPFSDADELTYFPLGPLYLCLFGDVSLFGDFWMFNRCWYQFPVYYYSLCGADRVFSTVDSSFWFVFRSPFPEFFPHFLQKKRVREFKFSTNRLYRFLFQRSVVRAARIPVFACRHNVIHHLSFLIAAQVKRNPFQCHWNFLISSSRASNSCCLWLFFVNSVPGFQQCCSSNGVTFNPLCIVHRITLSAWCNAFTNTDLLFEKIEFFKTCNARLTTVVPVYNLGGLNPISLFFFAKCFLRSS